MSIKNSDTMHNSGKNKKKKFSKSIPVLAITILVLALGTGLGFLTASIHTMPNLKSEIRPPASSQFFDINGQLIATTQSVENRLPVTLNKIPKNLQSAFIAAEDARFYQHIGVDPKGILRAVWANISNRGVSEGGSTITQQLAKNALLSQEQTLKRKIQEAVLALQIEHQYSKSEILEMYLNHIYFGQGAYGVEAAAEVYFGKNVEDLNLAECAMLAGIPKSPNYFSPATNFKAAKERQAIVLDQMVKYGYIDATTAAQARNTEIKIVSNKNKPHTEAAYFVDYVTQLLIDKYGADAVYKDGLKIYTTIDLKMQHAAEKAMEQLPTNRTDSNGIKQPQGALIAIDPHTGYIKAMVGGRGNDQFNRAVMAERQPGSAFKPFVYLAAIENGMTTSTLVDDSPVNYSGWSPKNYDGQFRGKVTLKTALEQSLNVPTVKIASQVGVDKPLYWAQQMGISTLVLQGPTNDRNLAMALGGLTKGVTPLEIASAYGVLANQGVRAEPMAIVKIIDRNGKIVENNAPREKVILNERNAYIITDMLRGVILHGTGTAANIGRPAAGKTGTTDDSKDAWFVGYTPDLVAAVWMGFDNDGYLNNVAGGTIPAKIWKSFMTAALAGVPAHDFYQPNGVPSHYEPEQEQETKVNNKTTNKATDNKAAGQNPQEQNKDNKDTKQDKPAVIPINPPPLPKADVPKKTN